MARIAYDERMATAYDRGRLLALDGLSAWRVALAPYFPGPSVRPVLDLGAGTGVFAVALAEWFDMDVQAVEPSAAMRRRASETRPHPRITYLAGDAVHLPLAAHSCEAVWLSTVIHHIPDLARCARELRWVLRPGGPVLIRGAFPGRLDRITLFRYFPAARAVAETFPTVEETSAAFATAGFVRERLEAIPQVSAPSLTALIVCGIVAVVAMATPRSLRLVARFLVVQPCLGRVKHLDRLPRCGVGARILSDPACHLAQQGTPT